MDSGGEDGIAIDIQGRTREIQISGNEIRETRQPMKRIGVRSGSEAGRVDLLENVISGFAQGVVDQRAATSGRNRACDFDTTGWCAKPHTAWPHSHNLD